MASVPINKDTGIDNIDLGFAIDEAECPDSYAEVDLTTGLSSGLDTVHMQDMDVSTHEPGGMPNLLQYLQPQETTEVNNSDVRDTSVYGVNSQEQRIDGTSGVGTGREGMASESFENTSDTLECNQNGEDHDQIEEPPPILADLISAALVETAHERSGEILDLDPAETPHIFHDNPVDVSASSNSGIRVVPTDVEVMASENMLTENMNDENSINVSMSGRNVPNEEEHKDMKDSAEVTNTISKSLVAMATATEVEAHVDALASSSVAMETNQDKGEGSANVDIPVMSTIMAEDPKDDEEFDFDLPTQNTTTSAPDQSQEILNNLRQEMKKLDMEIASLHVYEEGIYSAEPLETLQENIQATIKDSQRCFQQLQHLQSKWSPISSDSSKTTNHAESQKIQAWLMNTNDRLQNIQKLAHMKKAKVQDRMREDQAILAELDKANESLEITDARAVAAAEWDNVQTVTPELGDGAKGRAVTTIPMISFVEAIETDFNLQQYKPIIKTSVNRKGFGGFIHRLFGTKLQKGLHDERNKVFCLAACPYQDEYSVHWRVLQTIYRRLTGAKLDCPRYGGHWEQIGFQGTDPSTDLRGCGFLGLLQLLYMICDPMIYPLVKDMYRLSLHETQNFPFCIMGINMTRIVIQTLREDILNKECNKRKSVLTVVNELYVAAWLQMYKIWKTQHKTIADTGFVMKDVETYAKKNPQAMIAALNTHLAQNRSKVIQDDEFQTFRSVQDLAEG